jgi:hypothetical protein
MRKNNLKKPPNKLFNPLSFNAVISAAKNPLECCPSSLKVRENDVCEDPILNLPSPCPEVRPSLLVILMCKLE